MQPLLQFQNRTESRLLCWHELEILHMAKPCAVPSICNFSAIPCSAGSFTCQGSKCTAQHLHGAGARAWRLLLRHMQRRVGLPQALMRSRELGVSCNAGPRLPLCRSGCKQRLRVLVQAEVGDGLAVRTCANLDPLCVHMMQHVYTELNFKILKRESCHRVSVPSTHGPAKVLDIKARGSIKRYCLI